MKKNSNLFLIGLMGVGKTTIGKILAQELKMKFYDVDQEIEKSTGADISWIFELEGEAGFRQREIQAIDTLTKLNGIVLATGGGAIINPENRKNLTTRGIVIYLEADIPQLLQRTHKNQNRPLLANADPESVLKKLWIARKGFYQATADFTYNTTGRSVTDIAHIIAKDLREKKYF